MNKDTKKCVYSDSSLPTAATFFPMSPSPSWSRSSRTGPTARPACPTTRMWRRWRPSWACESRDFDFIVDAVNKDWKKCVYSDSSIPAAATFFPVHAIVKPILAQLPERGDDHHHPESVSAMKNKKDSDLYSTVKCKLAFYSRRCE